VTISLALFYVYATAAIVGAVGLVSAKRLVHAVMWMFVAMLSIAGLFLLMGSQFLSAMQLFVYGGAITVLVLFVLMLSKPSPQGVANPAPLTRWVAATVALALFAALAVVSWSSRSVPPTRVLPDTSQMAELLFSRFMLPFEIAGLLLTVALVGAIVLARRDDGVDSGEEPATAVQRVAIEGAGGGES